MSWADEVSSEYNISWKPEDNGSGVCSDTMPLIDNCAYD